MQTYLDLREVMEEDDVFLSKNLIAAQLKMYKEKR